MIKSKFGNYQFIGQFAITVLFILCLFLFYPAHFGKHPIPQFSGLGILSNLLTVLLPLYLIAQMKLNHKTTVIDPDSKTISFKMFLLPITKTYPFNYFDGYIDTVVKDKYGSYKCFYLVKEHKLKYKMSGRFYSNIDELKEGISLLKYMGFIKNTFPLSIKIALNKTVF